MENTPINNIENENGDAPENREKTSIGAVAFAVSALFLAFTGFCVPFMCENGDLTLSLIMAGISVGIMSFLLVTYRSPLSLLPFAVSAGVALIIGIKPSLVGLTVFGMLALSSLNSLLVFKRTERFTARVWLTLMFTVVIGLLSAFALSSVYGDVKSGIDSLAEAVGNTAGRFYDVYAEGIGTEVETVLGMTSDSFAKYISEYAITIIPAALTCIGIVMTFIVYVTLLVCSRCTLTDKIFFGGATVPPAFLAVLYIVANLVCVVSALFPAIVGNVALNIGVILSLVFFAEAVRIAATLFGIGRNTGGRIAIVVVFAIMLLMFPSILPIISAVMIIRSAARKKRTEHNE